MSVYLTGQAALLGHTGEDGVYYFVGFQNSLFAVMDSNADSPSVTAQTQALADALEDSTSTFKFLFFHAPVYPCGSFHKPFAAGLPWVDLAEQHGVDVIFSGHSHVYSRSCKLMRGRCPEDRVDEEGGLTQIELGPVGIANLRTPDVVGPKTVSGTDAKGEPRADTYDCDKFESKAGQLNSFCHVSVQDCEAKVQCYRVEEGNTTPFDMLTIDHCSVPEPPPGAGGAVGAAGASHGLSGEGRVSHAAGAAGTAGAGGAAGTASGAGGVG